MNSEKSVVRQREQMDPQKRVVRQKEQTDPEKSVVRQKEQTDPEKSVVRQKERNEQKTQKEHLAYYGEISQWFQTICFIKIPIFGFFYMLVLVLRKSTPREKRSFAAAFLMYRVLVLILALTILYVLYRVGLSFIDEILRYAGGL